MVPLARAAPEDGARARVPMIDASPRPVGSKTKWITFWVTGSVTPDNMAANVSSVASLSLSITGGGSVRASSADIQSAMRDSRLFVAGIIDSEFPGTTIIQLSDASYEQIR